jgi:hypothetical protein
MDQDDEGWENVGRDGGGRGGDDEDAEAEATSSGRRGRDFYGPMPAFSLDFDEGFLSQRIK